MIVLWWIISLLLAVCSAVAATVFYRRYVDQDKDSIATVCKKSQKLLILYAVFFIIYAILQMLVMMRRNESFLLTLRNLILINGFFLTATIDKKCLKIPNKLMLFLLIAGILFIASEVAILPKEWRRFVFTALIGLFVGGFFILVCMLLSRGGVGAGDMKMFAVCGLYFGYQGVLETMMFTLLLASVVSIGLLIFRKAKLKSSIPMAPFLLVGAFVYSFL